MPRKSEAPILTGRDLYLLAGFPRDTFNHIIKSLSSDRSRAPARYRGVPAPIKDWGPIYTDAGIRELLNKASDSLSTDDKQFDADAPSLPTPRRIILLYVPSDDQERLLQALDFFCYPAALDGQRVQLQPHDSPVAWRQNPREALVIARDTIDAIQTTLNELKAEITDKVICPIALPAENFHYPSSNERISKLYREIRQSGRLPPRDVSLPVAQLFQRDELSAKAFKSSASTDRFFEDARGLVFPPDPYHAKQRPAVDGKDDPRQKILALRQRYRFGVYVRDGQLHFDAQFRLPRLLSKHPMVCGAQGCVLVSGSHANVGVNDVIWTPDGSCVADPQPREDPQ